MNNSIDEFEKNAKVLIDSVFGENNEIASYQKEFVEKQSARLRRMSGIVEDLQAINDELRYLEDLINQDPALYKDSAYVKESVKRLGDTSVLLLKEYETLREF